MEYQVLTGDCIQQMKTLPDGSVNTCVTSPPYFGLRDYGHTDQIGLEATPDEFVAKLVKVFREVRRVLRDDGTLWLNIGDSYAGYWGEKYAHKPFGEDRTADATTPPNQRSPDFKGWAVKNKDLIGIPWMLAFALRSDGWYLRQDIIWSKPNPMPESVTDRCTKAHEYVFMLTKSPRYFYDAAAIKEPSSWVAPEPDGNASTLTGQKRHRANPEFNICMPEEKRRPDLSTRTDKQRGHGRRYAGFNDRWDGMTKEDRGAMGRNKRSVWTVATRPYAGAHFATFPPALIEPCILAGCPVGGTVLDPFGGSGTTAEVALKHGRSAILCELNPAYVELIHKRLSGLQYRIVA